MKTREELADFNYDYYSSETLKVTRNEIMSLVNQMNNGLQLEILMHLAANFLDGEKQDGY